jgi:RNA polymerase sigma-70 factor (ECF subfamily)
VQRIGRRAVSLDETSIAIVPDLMRYSAEQLAALVDRHAVPLQLWVGRRCLAADDVVQEAFCRLAVADPPPEQPVAWLYRVARNLAENQRVSSRRRRNREKQAAVPEASQNDPTEPLVVDEVLDAVLQLDDSFREVVTARIWGQLTFEEIGGLCEISTATASRRYRDALVQLRKLLNVSCPTSPP